MLYNFFDERNAPYMHKETELAQNIDHHCDTAVPFASLRRVFAEVSFKHGASL